MNVVSRSLPAVYIFGCAVCLASAGSPLDLRWLLYLMTFPLGLLWGGLVRVVAVTIGVLPGWVVDAGLVLTGCLQWFLLVPAVWRSLTRVAGRSQISNYDLVRRCYLGLNVFILVLWICQTVLFRGAPSSGQFIVLWWAISFPLGVLLPFYGRGWIDAHPYAGALMIAISSGAVGYLQWFVLFPRLRSLYKDRHSRP